MKLTVRIMARIMNKFSLSRLNGTQKRKEVDALGGLGDKRAFRVEVEIYSAKDHLKLSGVKSFKRNCLRFLNGKPDE